jgi:hypothetical protein
MGDVSMNAQPQTIEEKIEARIDQSTARDLAVSQQTGALTFTNARDAMEGAKMLAVGNFAIPKQFRGNPGACFAMIMQAAEWDMSPLQVINKSYVVNDRVAFESQLVQAVILRRAPLKDGVNAHFNIEFKGEGEQRTCRVSVALRNGDVVDYTSPPRGRITTQNSPLWKSDPDQQLFYYSARALCRRHFPHVLMGIYSKDEIDDQPAIGPDRARDVTPKTIAEKLDALTKAQDAVPDPADDWSQPVPHYVADEFAGYIPPEPPAPDMPDIFEPIRELARADAEKRLRRMAPTKLGEVEKEVYLRAFDLAKAEIAS